MDADFEGPLNYAYHFDAVCFARVLRERAKELGVVHVTDTVESVELDEAGAIASLTTRDHGRLQADLYVDCSGFQARLIGRAMGTAYQSCRSTLFCDRAVAIQVPYPWPDAPIASYTISTAQEAGWTWDIGLETRRGVGYVYSSAHTDDARAEQVLRKHIGAAADGLDARRFSFEAGYRETQWHKNCVAVGLSGGFFEPLEATGIVFIEVASILLAHLFPWNGELEIAARQFNRIMNERYRRVQDFLKMHYCLTQRTDTDFWRDNTRAETIPDTLRERLENWRFRAPEGLDFDLNVDSFSESSWQFVLYGMGYKTDLSAKAARFRFHEQARQEFAAIRHDAERAQTLLPAHRDLVAQVYRHGFTRAQAQRAPNFGVGHRTVVPR